MLQPSILQKLLQDNSGKRLMVAQISSNGWLQVMAEQEMDKRVAMQAAVEATEKVTSEKKERAWSALHYALEAKRIPQRVFLHVQTAHLDTWVNGT
ncbi:uncharacterized protein [Physcomitrium patens]|uniref:Uncharacterized protein n=1 Tax=Physcomitrium patens TaxID=3218 RepID=A0A2K1IJE4_PHYPA|nr:hypothetical protein PHYPA_028088 [Physcomitrium patens]